LLLVPLIAGAIAIFFTFRLNKRYRIPFVNSYFFYLVFLYIFGTYSLAGSGIMEFLLTRMEVDPKVIHSSQLYAIFLGIPFIGLSQFMFLRSTREFFNKKQSLLFIILYFSVILGAFVLYGLYMVKSNYSATGTTLDMVSLQRQVFCGFLVFVYLWAFLSILLWSRKQASMAKKFIRTFGASYLLFLVLSVALILIQPVYPYSRHLFLLVFLSLHLVPIFFLNLYLDKTREMEVDSESDLESRFSKFVEKHEISKRECEVVRLICQGYSNQEISDALFISLQTVKDHTHRIFVKTGVRNRVQLTNMIR
jgi:DNA-binding CsgD family transcriptional regulator/DMSO reductase anchor subunit